MKKNTQTCVGVNLSLNEENKFQDLILILMSLR